jgi:hypothetical protein
MWVAFAPPGADPAIAFLQSLDNEQRERTVYDFNHNSREFWSYLPGAMMPRFGISLAELSNHQKELAFELLRSALSQTGYDKATQIISLESVLAEIDGNKEFRDPEKYHIAFFGNPAEDEVWSWFFEGHHLSLNFANVGDKMAVAPRFLGASPALITSGPRKGEKTLGPEAELGEELVNSLSEEQRMQAVFQEGAYLDIVTGNAMEVSPLEPVGIPFDQLDEDQQTVLTQLIMEYLSVLPEELARKRIAQIQRDELVNLHFGWAGLTDHGAPHYYRIQGKSFIIEFDHTFNDANHIHTVWRDFNGDFGRDLLKEHYRRSDHH